MNKPGLEYGAFSQVRLYRDGILHEPADWHWSNGVFQPGIPSGVQAIDAAGAWLLPGLFALGVDFQEPVRDDIYTLKDGFDAMHRGGFTGALYESHANPLDGTQKLQQMQTLCSRSGLDIRFLGALSMEHHGKALAEMLEISQAGVVGFGDGNHPLTGLRFIRLALEYAGMTGKRCFLLPLEKSLAAKGCVHEGHYADTLGLRGIPSQAESIAVFQINALAQWLQVPVHLKQLTCAESLDLVRQAKLRGVDITCDVSLYHLLLDETSLFQLDTHTHLVPPLRTVIDREALWQGILDGTITAVSCAHTPVLPQDKETPFEESLPGAISLEVALPALLGTGRLSLADTMRLLGSAPAQLCGVENHNGFLLYHPNHERTLSKSDFAGQVYNSPLYGKKIQGKVLGICLDGVWRWNP